MSTTSDFNMLHLEAPQDLLQITDGTPAPEQVIEVANPAVWVWTMVRQQQQGENNLQQLTQLCGNTIDRTYQNQEPQLLNHYSSGAAQPNLQAPMLHRHPLRPHSYQCDRHSEAPSSSPPYRPLEG